MKTYNAIYETKSMTVSTAKFNANSLKEAKRLAQFHKNHTPEILKHRVRTIVYLSK